MITFVSSNISSAGVWPPPWRSPSFPYLLVPPELANRLRDRYEGRP